MSSISDRGLGSATPSCSGRSEYDELATIAFKPSLPDERTGLDAQTRTMLLLMEAGQEAGQEAGSEWIVSGRHGVDETHAA
jgi:hypothetical protein